MIASQEKAMKRISKLTTSSVALGLTPATWSTPSFTIGSAEQRASVWATLNNL
jgi:hypothetical protein